jgi:Asp/Glu/hydantoin racemase
MGRKVGMVHAGCFNVRLFNELTNEIMPGVEVVHLVDEGLPSLSDKQYHERVIRRLGTLSSFAEESGAEIIMLTCTAFGRLTDEVKSMVNIPVLAVLEIVADEAMKLSESIGILATHPGALSSASEIIQEQAALTGKKVEIKPLLCEGAFDALRHEDWATHDSIVLKRLNEPMADVKVIVIPQPSIDRVVKQIPEANRKVPILSSPRLATQRLKEMLDSLAPPA